MPATRKKKKNDLVSVIMPNYNCGRYIGRAIESVLAQTYPHWELIIVDDHSTDDSVRQVRPYLRDKRITLKMNKKNMGVARSRNTALRASKGRYIAFLDSDDRWYSQKLAKQLTFMKKNHAAISYTHMDIMDQEGCYIMTERVRKTLTYRDILFHHRIPNLTAIYDTAYIGKRYQSEQDRYVEDYILWLDILKEGYVAHGIDETLAVYTVGRSSFSSNKKRMARSVWKLLRHREKLPLLQAITCFADYAFYGLVKSFRRRRSV